MKDIIIVIGDGDVEVRFRMADGVDGSFIDGANSFVSVSPSANEGQLQGQLLSCHRACASDRNKSPSTVHPLPPSQCAVCVLCTKYHIPYSHPMTSCLSVIHGHASIGAQESPLKNIIDTSSFVTCNVGRITVRTQSSARCPITRCTSSLMPPYF